MKTRIRNLLVLSALGRLLLPLPLAAQAGASAEPAAIDTLLAAARIPNVLEGLAGALEQEVRRLSPELAPERQRRVREAAASHFTAEALHESVRSILASEMDAERLQELLAWMMTGEVAEARRLVVTYEPPLTLEEYTESLLRESPPEARVRLMLRVAQAQGAGPLYLVIAEALRGAAHAALRAAGEELPPFRGIPPEQVPPLLESYYQQAVVAFLHRYAPVPDELLVSVAEHYETDVGQWYVDALARAVGDAVILAAERMSAEVAGRPAGG